jgi:hypothetical protein
MGRVNLLQRERAGLGGNVAEMQRRGPRATVATFPSVGHPPTLIARDQIFTIERWLDPATPTRAVGGTVCSAG